MIFPPVVAHHHLPVSFAMQQEVDAEGSEKARVQVSCTFIWREALAHALQGNASFKKGKWSEAIGGSTDIVTE